MNQYVKRIFISTVLLMLLYLWIVVLFVNFVLDMKSTSFKVDVGTIESVKGFIILYAVGIGIQLLLWGKVRKKHQTVIVIMQGLLILSILSQLLVLDLMKMTVENHDFVGVYILYFNSIDSMLCLISIGILVALLNFGLCLYYWLYDIDLVDDTGPIKMSSRIIYVCVCLLFILLNTALYKNVDTLTSLITKRQIEVAYKASDYNLQTDGYNGYGFLKDVDQRFEFSIDLELKTKRIGFSEEYKDAFLDLMMEHAISIEVFGGRNGYFKNGDSIKYRVFVMSEDASSEELNCLRLMGDTLQEIEVKGLKDYAFSDEQIIQLSETVIKEGAQKFFDNTIQNRLKYNNASSTANISLSEIIIVDPFSEEEKAKLLKHSGYMHEYTLQIFPLHYYTKACLLCNSLVGKEIQYVYSVQAENGEYDTYTVGFEVNDSNMEEFYNIYNTASFENLEDTSLFKYVE